MTSKASLAFILNPVEAPRAVAPLPPARRLLPKLLPNIAPAVVHAEENAGADSVFGQPESYWDSTPPTSPELGPSATTRVDRLEIANASAILALQTSIVSLQSADQKAEPAIVAVSPVVSNPKSVSLSAPRRKKKITVCKEPGCKSQALSKQLCMRHGGGPRCIVEGCNNGAKLRNHCFQHGGSTTCLAEGCSSKAKRFGYCWSHGGGRICAEEGCSKVAAQGGMCWAHGGGNRCRLQGCTKRSYRQNGYYCKRHSEVFSDY
ncbi:hypothetical protein PINS_up013019 [Pythium insidiosum]|nr:hypothetical protein PINS_up013019 [Pythium insidiosum]